MTTSNHYHDLPRNQQLPCTHPHPKEDHGTSPTYSPDTVLVAIMVVISAGMVPVNWFFCRYLHNTRHNTQPRSRKRINQTNMLPSASNARTGNPNNACPYTMTAPRSTCPPLRKRGALQTKALDRGHAKTPTGSHRGGVTP